MEIEPTDSSLPATRSEEGVGRFDYARNKPAYLKKLSILSNISARNQVDHVDAIDWDNPENEVKDDDERWIFPADFDIGAHPWYQNLPKERQIEIAQYRYAQICLIGVEFEEALIKGVAAFHTRPGNAPEENEYTQHEANEEAGHIRMFRKSIELVNPDVKGAPAWFHRVARFTEPIAKHVPVGFWQVILTGEEPIDRMQRSLLDREKQGAELPGLIHNVMQLHVEEEARHISFAHMYLERHVDPRRTDMKSRLGHKALSLTNPLLNYAFANFIVRPSWQSAKDMGIPREVYKETWFDSEDGKERFRDLFPNMRKHADKLQLRRTKAAQGLWRVLGMAEKIQTKPE